MNKMENKIKSKLKKMIFWTTFKVLKFETWVKPKSINKKLEELFGQTFSGLKINSIGDDVLQLH